MAVAKKAKVSSASKRAVWAGSIFVMGVGLEFATGAPPYTSVVAFAVAGILGLWGAYKHYREGDRTARRRRRFWPASAGIIVVTGFVVWLAWPVTVEIVVSEKFSGQWPGYTNADEVLLDDSARFTMQVGETQSIFFDVGGSENLSNVYLAICVSRTFSVIELTESERQGYATFAHDDVDFSRSEWSECERYTVPMGRINAGLPMNPNPIRFRALSEGTFTFRHSVSAAEAELRDGYFPVTVAP